MISVQEASAIIFSNLYRPSGKSIPIEQAIGHVLAEAVLADRDMPPFNRVTMDGIAINFEVWKAGQRKFFLEGMQAAGEEQKKLNKNENAMEVMTGAVLPQNTDTVIRYEDLAIDAGIATVIADPAGTWQSVHLQGQDAAKGIALLQPGMMLSAAEIALLASVGKAEARVYQYPKTGIVASGDELVEIQSIPLPHQIRRSNTYAIEAAMRSMGWAGQQFHLPDDRKVLKVELEKMIRAFEVIILSGGVSQGKLDFIPSVMEEIGVKKLFHQVSQRPGKPFWFGVSEEGKPVFALPGNPVSTFMCFYKYIRPWLLRSLSVNIKANKAILAKDFTFPPKLTCFLQVSTLNEDGKIVAYPDAGGGSGDFVNLKKIDGFLELPADRSEFKAGEAFPFIAFRL